MDNTVQNAAPVAEAITSDISFEAFSQRVSPKEEVKQTKPEDAAPSKESSEPKKAEPAPAPEAGKEQEPKPHKANASERSRELDSEISELKAKLAERAKLRKELQEPPTKEDKPASSKADTDEFGLKAPERPKRPKQTDFETYEAYENALEKYDSDELPKYAEDMADYKAERKLRERDAKQQETESTKQLTTSLKEGRDTYQDFDAKAYKLVEQLASTEIHPAVRDRIMKSDILPHLLYVMGGDKLNDFIKIAKVDPVDAISRIAVIEHLTREGLNTPEKKAPETPVTKAPKPVTELSARGAGGEDPATAAVRANDYAAASAEWDRQALAGRKK